MSILESISMLVALAISLLVVTFFAVQFVKEVTKTITNMKNEGKERVTLFNRDFKVITTTVFAYTSISAIILTSYEIGNVYIEGVSLEPMFLILTLGLSGLSVLASNHYKEKGKENKAQLI